MFRRSTIILTGLLLILSTTSSAADHKRILSVADAKQMVAAAAVEAKKRGVGGSIAVVALGNFPQAFTHLALISAAFNLDRALSGRK